MSRSMTVTAPKVNRSVEFTRDFGGTTLAEKTTVYGEEVVTDLFDQMCTVKCASVVRAALKARDEEGNFKYSDEQAIQIGLAYVPAAGAKRTPKDVYAGIVAKILLGTTSKEEVIKELKARLASLGVK